MNVLIAKLEDEISIELMDFLRKNFDFSCEKNKEGYYTAIDGESMDNFRLKNIPLDNAKIYLLSEKVYNQVVI